MGVCAATTFAACLFPSLDGLAGDGGTDVLANDAPADATTTDAPSDAMADAGDVLDAQTTKFSCAQVDAKFCDDFDDDDAQAFSHWSSAYFQNGTIARIAGDASPPFDIRVDVYTWSDGGTTSPYALLHRGFVDPLTSSATLSFDMRVDQYASGTNDYFNTADLELSGASSNGTNLVFGANRAVLQEQVRTDAGSYVYPQHPLTKLVPLGKWTHVDVHWTFAPSNVTVQVSFDTQVVLPALTLDSRLTYAIPLLTMGATYVNSGSDHAGFEVDNVVFDFQ